MASNRRVAWGIGLLVAAVAGALLLVHFTRKPTLRTTIEDIQPAEPHAAAPHDPGAAARRDPPVGLPHAERPASDPASAGGADDVPPAGDGGGIGPQLPVARKWKLEAQQKQLALYRTQVEANMRALDKLGQTIERLKREGATAEQIEQIQRRLRQMREADTRMRLHLQQLEKELPAAQEGGQP